MGSICEGDGTGPQLCLREEEYGFINDLCAESGGIECGACFEKHGEDLPFAEPLQDSLEIDAACIVAFSNDFDLHPACTECTLRFVGCAFAAEDKQIFSRAFDDT